MMLKTSHVHGLSAKSVGASIDDPGRPVQLEIGRPERRSRRRHRGNWSAFAEDLFQLPTSRTGKSIDRRFGARRKLAKAKLSYSYGNVVQRPDAPVLSHSPSARAKSSSGSSSIRGGMTTRRASGSVIRYPVGTKLQVKYGSSLSQIYKAKVVSVSIRDDRVPYYLVHYHGWSRSHDAWITQKDVLSVIEQPTSIDQKTSKSRSTKFFLKISSDDSKSRKESRRSGRKLQTEDDQALNSEAEKRKRDAEDGAVDSAVEHRMSLPNMSRNVDNVLVVSANAFGSCDRTSCVLSVKAEIKCALDDRSRMLDKVQIEPTSFISSVDEVKSRANGEDFEGSNLTASMAIKERKMIGSDEDSYFKKSVRCSVVFDDDNGGSRVANETLASCDEFAIKNLSVILSANCPCERNEESKHQINGPQRIEKVEANDDLAEQAFGDFEDKNILTSESTQGDSSSSNSDESQIEAVETFSVHRFNPFEDRTLSSDDDEAGDDDDALDSSRGISQVQRLNAEEGCNSFDAEDEGFRGSDSSSLCCSFATISRLTIDDDLDHVQLTEDRNLTLPSNRSLEEENLSRSNVNSSRIDFLDFADLMVGKTSEERIEVITRRLNDLRKVYQSYVAELRRIESRTDRRRRRRRSRLLQCIGRSAVGHDANIASDI